MLGSPDSTFFFNTQVTMPDTCPLPKAKQTILGLYLTAKEAYSMWQANPEEVIILDTRTLEELLFVGHPPMAWRVPVASQNYTWDEDKKQYGMTPLFDFATRVAEIANSDTKLLVMCRSGGRSAIACNMLAQAGFTNVYNIIDGMEGDGHGDSESTPMGGWKNSGCPWTKKLTPERIIQPKNA